MKSPLAIVSCAAAVFAGPPSSRAAGVWFDAEKHSVSFTVVSTDCGLDTPVEFLFAGPGSDHDYESMFLTEAPVAEIEDAFAKAGIATGAPVDSPGCRFWPVGAFVEMEPSFGTFVRETFGETVPKIVHTGGSREPTGEPVAATNMPLAVFALYNFPQSLLQLDDSLDQSPTYGRFRPAVKIPKGEKRTVTFRLSGPPARRETATFVPGGAPAAFAELRAKSSGGELDVLCDFSPELELSEAAAVAGALSAVDSPEVKINGFAKGRFYFRAFLPLEKWRDPKERLCQPPEVHFAPDGSVKVVETREKWPEGDSLDPELARVEHPAASLEEAAKKASELAGRTYTMLLFAPASTKLSLLYDFKAATSAEVLNWYVFPE